MKVVVAEFQSVDGVSEDPGRIGTFAHRGWMIPYFDEALTTYQIDQLNAADALLLGRRSYEEFRSLWPARAGEPYADRMNSLPKFVASATLAAPLDWNATLLEGSVADAVRELKEQPGGNLLVFGSLGLAHSLMADDLVDVFQLMIVPVALGSGRRFFTERPEMTSLALTDVQTNGTGVVMLTYERPATAKERSATDAEASGGWWRRRTQGES